MDGKKTIRLIVILCLANILVVGCGKKSSGADDASQKKDSTEFEAEQVGIFEAEDGSFTGNVGAKTDADGTEYVAGFASESDTCTITITVAETGFYDLVFTARSSDYKENYVHVDGIGYGTLVTQTKDFSDSTVSYVYLESGSHEVKITSYWGYTDIDKLVVMTTQPIGEEMYEVSAKLSNPDASEETRRLMSYLADSYGEVILSGQYCDNGRFGKEFSVINKVTGYTPAVLGLDFIEYSPSRAENGSVSNATQYAIDFWNNGGIVTFCWHWNAPSKYLTGLWYKGFSSDSTNIDLTKIMNGEDPEGYELLLADIDAIAQQLLILQDAGVPVVWRPLHEASGGWFWWGASGSDSYKKLYILLYNTLTEEYGLNNLIWLWNGQDEDWYPGDEYVDIIGWDIYPGEREYGSQVGTYLRASKISSENKMIVLSENGCVFDPALAKRDGAMWGFWCTWGSDFVAKDSTIYAYSDTYTEREKLAEFYSNEIVITLDEVPDLRNYPIREELQ